MYSGNATVVNWLMRFPVLIPAAVTIGVIANLPDPKPEPPVEPPKVELVVPPPVPPAPPVIVEPPKLKTIDELCPPEGQKVSKKDKLVLLGRGCKVRG